MGDRPEFGLGVSSDPLSWRFSRHQFGMFGLDPAQLIHQLVVLGIAGGWLVQHEVFIGKLIELKSNLIDTALKLGLTHRGGTPSTTVIEITARTVERMYYSGIS
jgi:hypothetical protein